MGRWSRDAGIAVTTSAARGLVLAAGRSRRMGALKPLLPLDDVPAAVRAARAFSDVGVLPLVVLGFSAADIAPALGEADIEFIVNDDFDQGMSSSVRAGLAAVEHQGGARWTGVLPADCCLVRPETVGRLGRAMVSAGTDVVYPVFEGRRGHPPLLGPGAQALVLAAPPEATLRDVLAGLEVRALDVAVDDIAVLLDMDDKADYERVAELARRERLPDAGECEALLERRGTPRAVREHAESVAVVVRALGEALQPAGAYLDLALLDAAARLHDVARDEPDHAAAGARWLTGAGHPRVAAVVALHMTAPARPPQIPDEAELLFLADKLVDGRRIVTLEERLQRTLARFAGDPEAEAAARRRLQEAAGVAAAVERLTGRPLARLVAAPSG